MYILRDTHIPTPPLRREIWCLVADTVIAAETPAKNAESEDRRGQRRAARIMPFRPRRRGVGRTARGRGCLGAWGAVEAKVETSP